MGGEDQLKGFIKQGIQLQDSADKVELLTAGALALALFNIKRMVETMPQEGLLRNKSWRQLEPLVRIELERYADELGKQMVRTVADSAPAMRDASVREFENAGAVLPPEVSKKRQPVPDAVQKWLDGKGKSTINQSRRGKGMLALIAPYPVTSAFITDRLA